MDCLFFINPESGGMEGRRLIDTLNSDCPGCGHNIHAVFINRNNMAGQVTSLVPGKELVVIAGGDGTVSQIVACLSMLDSPPPFAVIPIGTGNDLARNTGWFKIWQEGGIEAFFAALRLSRVESIDIWGFDNGPRFLCYAGIGIDAEIISFIDRYRGGIPDSTKWRAGRRLVIRLLYCAAAVKYAASGLAKRKKQEGRIEFYLKGDLVKSVDCKRTEGLIITSLDRYAGGGHLSETACRNDGIFEVYRFPSLNSYMKFLIKSRMGGRFKPEPELKADRADFSSVSALPVQVDGEPYIISHARRISTISLQRAIPVFIPPPDLAAREKVRRKSLEKQGVKARISPMMPGAATGSHMERPASRKRRRHEL